MQMNRLVVCFVVFWPYNMYCFVECSSLSVGLCIGLL